VWEANGFAFVRNNPLRWVDGDGRMTDTYLGGRAEASRGNDGDHLGELLVRVPIYTLLSFVARGSGPWGMAIWTGLSVAAVEGHLRAYRGIEPSFTATAVDFGCGAACSGVGSGVGAAARSWLAGAEALARPLPATWNEFQGLTRGSFATRREAGVAWRAFRLKWGIGSSGGKVAATDAAVHGNSRLSPRIATLYRLVDEDGNLLKWGVTQDPGRRYTQAFLLHKRLVRVTEGNRAEILDSERFFVETQPGPLNRERWAGARVTASPE